MNPHTTPLYVRSKNAKYKTSSTPTTEGYKTRFPNPNHDVYKVQVNRNNRNTNDYNIQARALMIKLSIAKAINLKV